MQIAQWMAAKAMEHTEVKPAPAGDTRVDTSKAPKPKLKKKPKQKMSTKKFRRLKGPSDYYSPPYDSITEADRQQKEVL